MKLARLVPILGLLPSCFVACSAEQSDSPSTGTSSTAAATASDVAAFCDAQCAFSERCPEPDIITDPAFDCRANCAAKMGTNPVYRKASISAMAGCYGSLACEESDDRCTSEGILNVTADPANYPGTSACLARHDACDASSDGGFSDDHCGTRILLIPEAADAFDDCLAGPCADVTACLHVIVGRT